MTMRKTIERLGRTLRLLGLLLPLIAIEAQTLAAARPAAAAVSADFNAAAFDAKVAAMMRDWRQPGLSIAIVKGGRIIHERGFGVRNSERGGPVDANTEFGIASLTKSFAAASVAKLVGEGKLEWDAPVTRYIPWFQMPRERDTSEVTLRDLLTMRSGLGSSEYSFRRVSTDRRDHVRRVRYLQQVHPLRSEYLYTTDSYTVIGEVIASVTGMPWERYAAANFWGPLGMKRTNADHRVARADPNAASPHLSRPAGFQPIEWIYEDEAAQPAGGVNSTAHDLALWLQFQLAGGVAGGKRLIAEAPFRESHMPQTLMRGEGARGGPDSPAEGIRFNSYAMGWTVQDYRGHTVIAHSGGIDGFRTWMAYLPGDDIGVVVLGNTDQGVMPLAVLRTAIDDLLGLTGGPDWNQFMLARAQRATAADQKKLADLDAARIKGTQPDRPLSDHLGTFADRGAFGTVKVGLDAGHLVIDAGKMRYDLEHWHHEVFKARPRWPYEVEERNFFVTFDLDASARIAGFDFSTGYSFKRTD
jgi:CubicO group peptidase (beta-lactamase class C family)